MKLLRKIVFLFLVCALIFFLAIEYIIHIPIVSNSNFHYILKAGTSSRDIANDLRRTTNLTHPIIFRLISRLKGVDHKLQAGEYIFPKDSSIYNIINQLANGQVVSYDFTIVNGWNIWRVMDSLNKQPYVKHTLTNLTLKEVAKKLKIRHNSPEGLLFPDTYRYAKGAKDLDILIKAHQLMLNKIKVAWAHRAKDLWYKNQYQALIVASMIEKESSFTSEKPLIAAVILKRLQKWMHLQIDATVIYGLGREFDGKISIKDLRHKTRYNTYTSYGLPPTPISMPGQASIEAALHPAKTDALYFVSKGDGTHIFSATLNQHDKQVRKYQINKGRK